MTVSAVCIITSPYKQVQQFSFPLKQTDRMQISAQFVPRYNNNNLRFFEFGGKTGLDHSLLYALPTRFFSLISVSLLFEIRGFRGVEDTCSL